ncbi:MAG: hypothetical protein K2M17_03335 [Bacilli bacterium]|nr:hypothetical protein [Bacilli bacterium]
MKTNATNKTHYVCGYSIFNHDTKSNKKLLILILIAISIISAFFCASSIFSIVQFAKGGKYWAYVSTIADISISLASIAISFVSIWSTYKANIKVSNKLNRIIDSNHSLFPKRLAPRNKINVFKLNIIYNTLLIITLENFFANSVVKLCYNTDILKFDGVVLSWLSVGLSILLSLVSIADCILTSHNTIVDIEEIHYQYNALFELYNNEIIFNSERRCAS